MDALTTGCCSLVKVAWFWRRRKDTEELSLTSDMQLHQSNGRSEEEN